MFIGHLGAGLALKRISPRINLGWLFAATMLLDVVLWIFVLAGMEKVHIPENYARQHFLTFDFPYSHSLLAALLWTAMAAAIAGIVVRRPTAAWAIGAAVFSHFVFDWIEHPPELPLAGMASAKLGLGLWGNMPVALGLEAVLAAVGLWLYLRGTTASSFGGRYGLAIFLVVLSGFAFGGQLLAPAPSSMAQVALSSLITLVVVFVLAGWLDRKRAPRD